MSVSRMPVRWPARANERARLTGIFQLLSVPRLGLEKRNVPAMVDFPTPPLAELIAITFFTSLILRFCGSPRCMRGICGGAPVRGRP